MNLQDCIKFANENPVCFLATCENSQPRVRGVLQWFANESGFYFAILSTKNMSDQLHKNPNVEVCFYNHPAELGNAVSMRVTGKMEFLDDPGLKQKAYESRKFLDDIAGQSIEPYLEIIRLGSGDIHFWTMADVMKEKQLEHLKF
ncbi:MAG: pyridoxamine 5'-phosphate oxidase family protein [Bacteroidales bacterium]|nr:pyridoxamine 5'-phosphate oxidase family protein [Bacteroidales bacterium]